MPPACSSLSRRSPSARLPVAGVLVLGGVLRGVLVLDGHTPPVGAVRNEHPRSSPRAPRCAWRGRRCRPRRHDGLRRRRFRAWPTSIQRSSVPCAEPQRMPRTTGSSSSSTAAGVPRSTRSNYSSEAVSKYGSEEEAARWVATPTTSAHVSGDAVDIGRSDATAWLSEHGAGTGCARSTATNAGTTNCAPKPSITVARPCTPTRRTIRGRSSDKACGSRCAYLRKRSQAARSAGLVV